jgi:fused signal recognition particle receptor
MSGKNLSPNKKLKDIISSIGQRLNMRLGFAGSKDKQQIISQVEEFLILSDFSKNLTELIIFELDRRITGKEDDVLQVLTESILAIMQPLDRRLNLNGKPSVILLTGINGAGKTSTAAKLARLLQNSGLETVIAIADTFRAAAQEQAAQIAQLAGSRVIQGMYGADPASVAYDAIASAIAKGADIVLIDTGGRIHTNHNLMKELEKVKTVCKKQLADAPHEILLIADSTLGQNTIVQARQFNQSLGLTGIVLTKLDSKGRGGTALTIEYELGIPIKLLTYGKDLDAISEFSPELYIKWLFQDQ